MIKIKQISVDGDPNSKTKILGLGEDSLVYYWNWIEERWVLASRKAEYQNVPSTVTNQPRKKRK